jgi:hypothetical protein
MPNLAIGRIRKTLRLACAVGLLGSIAAAAPQRANAEPPLGSRLGERTSGSIERGNIESLRMVREWAGCAYLKRPNSVRSLLDARAEALATKNLANLTREVGCTMGTPATANSDLRQFRTSPDIMRGLLAEAVLNEKHVAKDLPPLPIQQIYTRDWFGMTGRNIEVDIMSACVAETNPGAINALIGTIPGTAEEGAAISAIAPSLGPCLRAGAKLNANRQSLRAALAEALYQRAFAPAVPAAPAMAQTKQ